MQYISPEYIQKLKEDQAKVLQSFDWDVISFAQHVPMADIEVLENKIIETGSGIKMLAFAKDVKGANINKLRKAIVKTGEIDIINNFYLLFGSKPQEERE